jgi:hypothetical protein
MPPKKTNPPSHSRRKPRIVDDWERSWSVHWSKAGTIGYELPILGERGEEAAFLTEIRTPEKEAERLERIQNEFLRGFERLQDLGPAVTVFGSARFTRSPTLTTNLLVRSEGNWPMRVSPPLLVVAPACLFDRAPWPDRGRTESNPSRSAQCD